MGVKLGSNRALWAGAALLLGACGGGGGAPPAPFDEDDSSTPHLDASVRHDGGTDAGDGGHRDAGDGGGDGGSDSGHDGGDGGGDGGVNPLGPVLELLYPGMPDSPGATDVLVGSTLSVRCRASKNAKGELVNPGSVKIALYDGDAAMAFISQVATSTSETDVFKADVSLTGAPQGTVRVECSADDVAQTKQHSAISVNVLYDRGPLITFLNPTANGFVPAGVGEGEDVRVRFKVSPQPLNDADDGAGVADIHVAVGGKEIMGIEESATEAYVYSFGIDFNDSSLFTVIPNTLSLRVDATDQREPAGASSASLSVGVDSEGPVIKVIKPVGLSGAEPIVSGKVDITLDVTDDLAGVDDSSLEMRIAVLGLSTKTYPVEAQGSHRYTTTFEVGEFPDSSSLTLNFIARDTVGNEATASQGIRIDDQPPWVSLTPAPVRDRTPHTRPQPDDCSGPFDPLGDVPDDGDIVQKAVRLRALAWDRPRVVSGQQVFHYAMVDEQSVQIVVQHDTSIPLLINSNGISGGPCDAVNLKPNPIAKAPVVIELMAMKPQGTAPIGYDLVETAPGVYSPVSNMAQDPNVSSSQSVYSCAPTGGTPPATLCNDPVMSRLIRHVAVGSNPVVFGINVTTTICTGDFYSNPSPGPACLVAQANDNAGNTGFSEPIRVCVEYADGEDQVVTCPPGVLDGITCTDGCVLPTKFGPTAPDRMPPVISVN